MALTSGSRLGPYEIVTAVGAGGMGEVYRATDTNLGRQVAIKILPEAFAQDVNRLARFEREARLLATLNHPNIAGIYGLEQSGARKFIVMELVAGETLAERIRRGPIPVDESLGIAKQIADALEAAHESEKGIIHRDLKPANVKITPTGQVKVLDFGLAKAHEPDRSSDLSNSPTLSVATTNAGAILGTAAYMSPEQAKGMTLDRRTDIFSLGAVLYEMLTGRQAFSGETLSDILASVLKSEPDWTRLPKDTPTAIRRLLQRCLRKDRNRRLKHAEDVRIEIEDLQTEPDELEGDSIESRAAVRLGERSPFTGHRINRWGWPLAILTGTVAIVLGALYFRSPVFNATSVRFTIRPESMIGQQGTALSPDGRYLAFLDDDGTRNGQPAIWLRALDSLEPRMLPGTGGAVFPTWSPDGKYILFAANRRIQRVLVDGGSPETLSDGPNVQAAWGPDGMIVFRETAGGLLQLAGPGAVPAKLTTVDRSRDEVQHMFPQFLPDGRHVLYFVLSNRADYRGVYVVSVDSGSTKRILSADSSAVYSDPGYLLVVRETTLMAYPFDTSTLEITGAPVRIADNVGVSGNITSVSASRTGILAYRADSAQHVEIASYDRTGRSVGTIGQPDRFVQARLSPDETRVALQKVDQTTGLSDIWLLELSTRVLSKFTLDPGSETDPAWSPDGRHIAYSSARSGNNTDVYQKEVGGTEETPLSTSSDLESVEDWARDGSGLISRVDAGQGGVFLIPRTGGRTRVPLLPPVPFRIDAFNVSPDGRWIAYNSAESGRFEVWVASFPKFTNRRQISNSGGAVPRWRKDGKELFYLTLDGKMMAVEVNTGVSIEVSTPTFLFQTRLKVHGGTDQYAVTGDGQRFLLLEPLETQIVRPITVITNWTSLVKR